MIVKNESMVIRRCLDSVRNIIDHWVIVDTGSTDGTQDIVRAALAGIPGELYERPWHNFGHNRNEALDLARTKADYLLFIDADETLHCPHDFVWPGLAEQGYYLHAEYGGTTYSRGALISTKHEWRWTGVIHEYLSATPPAQLMQLEWPRILVSHDGARARDPKTYEKDAAILEQALADEPQNARYAFYLAQSYRDAEQFEKALDAYRRRAVMPGWDEETWYSLYEIGRMNERLAKPAAEVQGTYLAAYQFRPQRAEPLYQLARYHRERQEYALAYLFARQANTIPRPSDKLFVDDSVYQWRNLDELSVAASWVGAKQEGKQAIDRLIGEQHLPASERPRVEGNLRFYA
ncbi:MAG: glycosyltransferase [Burkholderiales bacterium]